MHRVPDRIELRACAKVNLILSVAPPEIGGQRAGWHRIASWMSAIDLHDDVILSRLADGENARAGVSWADDAPRPTPIDWPIAADLAVRAHWLLEERCGERLPCEIVVRKRIPVGGGLGGGSSDAAAAMMGINQLFALGLSTEQLRELSTALGSDVAFFIDDDETPRPAIVEGFGDHLQRRPRVAGDVTLLIPPFGCSTRDVYQRFDHSLPDGHALRDQLVRHIAQACETAGAVVPTDLFNDLYPAADVVSGGQLGAAARLMEHAGWGRVCMSGSGSTMYCLAAARGAIPSGWTAMRTKLV